MYIKMWGLMIGLCLLLTLGRVAAAADSPSPTFLFESQKVASGVKFVTKNEAKYVNLAFLNKYLNAVTNYDPTKGNLLVSFGKLDLTLNKDNTEYILNDQHNKLSVAPFEQDNQFWIPVELLLKLGMFVIGDDTQHFELGWAESYLLGMKDTTYQGRPAFVLMGTKAFKSNGFLLDKPARLVIDLTGIKAHPSFDESVKDNPLVAKIRFHQSDPTNLRVVFDLTKMIGYKLIVNPDNANQLIIVFNYFIEQINFTQKDDSRKLTIKTSSPAKYTVSNLQNPNRLVIDFDGASLSDGIVPIAGDNQWISGVRMSQFSTDKVRVVLDLVTNSPCFVVPSRQDPKLLEVRTTQTIAAVNWTDADSGGKLTVISNSSLVENINKMQKPDKLQLDFDYAQFAPGLQAPNVTNSQIKGVTLLTVSGSKVRVEINLAYFVGYTAQCTEDRRQLTITFRRSPLIGKTIVLDPGHGGYDPGASGRQGTLEKDINLDVAMRLKDLLEGAGAQVVMTRYDDTFVGLYERSYMANYIFADLFLSIHSNNNNNPTIQGIEVYHFDGHNDSRLLGQCVISDLSDATGLGNRGVLINDFVVIRESQMPSILVELGYLSNTQEETTIRTPEFKVNAAQGIFRGIVDYYQK